MEPPPSLAARKMLVPAEGVEPTRRFGLGSGLRAKVSPTLSSSAAYFSAGTQVCLSPPRLPFRHAGLTYFSLPAIYHKQLGRRLHAPFQNLRLGRILSTLLVQTPALIFPAARGRCLTPKRLGSPGPGSRVFYAHSWSCNSLKIRVLFRPFPSFRV